MTKKSHQKCWPMKIENFFRKRKFSTESEHFWKIGGNLKHGGDASWLQGGWTPLQATDMGKMVCNISSPEDSSPDDYSHGLFVPNSKQMLFNYLLEGGLRK